jgi:cytoskeletal protein RodZ
MQSVGTRLREARIKKGYTLEDINARTRISLRNLNAIESDDLAKISSPFTYRSFVKQVADLLGLDYAVLAADAQVASSTMPEPLVPGQEEEVHARPHQYQAAKPKANWNWLRMASIAGVAGVVSVYLIWRNGGLPAAKLTSNSPAASSRVVIPTQESTIAPVRTKALPQQQRVKATPAQGQAATKTDESAATQPPLVPSTAPGTEQLLPPSQVSVRVEPSTQTSQTAADAQPSPALQEPETAMIHIELSAIQPTWLSVSADGKTTYRGTLGAMQTMSFDGKETAQIRTANAGGVNIIFNGRALGPLGRRGQSRTFVFTKSGYEVVHGVGNTTMAHAVHTGG